MQTINSVNRLILGSILLLISISQCRGSFSLWCHPVDNWGMGWARERTQDRHHAAHPWGVWSDQLADAVNRRGVTILGLHYYLLVHVSTGIEFNYIRNWAVLPLVSLHTKESDCLQTSTGWALCYYPHRNWTDWIHTKACYTHNFPFTREISYPMRTVCC